MMAGRGGRAPTSDQAFNRMYESESARAPMRNEGGGRWYGREVPLTQSRLERTASPLPNPEEQLIAAEEHSGVDTDCEPETTPESSERVLAIVRGFLPAEEAYLLEAHFMRGQHQSAVAERLGRAKQSVQYRIGRALARIRWAMTLESWDRSRVEIHAELRPPLSQEEADFTFTLWSQKWNQSRTAQRMGATQSHVRIRIMRLHRVLQEHRESGAVGPYARDLARIIEARAWCMGSGQVQGPRAIEFPKFPGAGKKTR